MLAYVYHTLHTFRKVFTRHAGPFSFRLGVANEPQNELKGFSPRGLASPARPHDPKPFPKDCLMIPQSRPLIEVFADIPDFRQSKGKRHPLSAILSLACCAMLCGYRSYSAIAEWGRNYGTPIAQALGFIHQTPCAATLHTIFRQLDHEVLEAKLGAWADEVMTSVPAADAAPEEAMAVDGKTLRGSKKQGAPGTHVLSVVGHRLGLTLTQQAVDDKTNEIKAIETVLEQIVLTGRILTMDALLTQRQVAQTIVNNGGDYVMIVKNNQPQLRADIELVFALPPWGDHQPSTRTVEVTSGVGLTFGHGRIESRNLTTSEALVGYSDWPGLAQVFEVGRHVIEKKTGEERVELVYGVTSLSAERATPERLLELVRGHWAIENRSHWVRDVTYDEDRSQVRSGSIPQVMAALRNTAIGLLRSAGCSKVISGKEFTLLGS
jgi:predicted transposase YbfD/YdcC